MISLVAAKQESHESANDWGGSENKIFAGLSTTRCCREQRTYTIVFGKIWRPNVETSLSHVSSLSARTKTTTKELIFSDASRMPAHRYQQPYIASKSMLYYLHVRVVLLGELCTHEIL